MYMCMCVCVCVGVECWGGVYICVRVCLYIWE